MLAKISRMTAFAFGKLVQKLRDERRITQAELGSLSGIASGTISRIERGVDTQLRRTTVGRIVKALNRNPPLSEAEVNELWTAAGMGRIIQELTHIETPVSVPAKVSLSAFTTTLKPDEARVYWYLADMIDRVGVLPVLKLFEGISQIAGVSLEPPVEAPRTISHVSPPIQKDGYTEQVVTDFEVPAKPAAPATRPIDRRRVGG